MADKLRPITYGRTAALAAAIAVLLGSSSARAGSPTINTQGEVGQTDYSSLPFAGSIFAQSYGASAGLLPANLFWQYGSNFTNAKGMTQARQGAARPRSRGIVPVAGAQRWEDTYEASQPASLFPGEPAWIASDRKAGGFTGRRDFQAWVGWERAHANLFTLGADGGSEGVDFRKWHGSWGHISPLMPLPKGDWPPGVKNATYGDWFAYRWGQIAQRSGAYGIALSDFTDSQPISPSYMLGFNPQFIAGF